MKKMTLILALSVFMSSCAVIIPGEAGVKQILGKFSDKVITGGTKSYNPFIGKVLKESTPTNNIELILSLPSEEGLRVNSEI